MQLFGVVLVFIIGITSVSSSSGHPNVLLIVVDDLRPTLGCYGDTLALTPNIDALADRGILFTKAYAQQALCGPSRTSFLTSRRPDTTRLYDVHSYWRNHAGNFTTLPQYFKEHGYHTMSAGKVFHPGIVSNKTDDQPYSWSEDPYHPPTQAHKQDPVCLGNDGKLYTNIYCPVQIDQQPSGSLPDIQTTEFATTWLQDWAQKEESGDEKQPFFLAVGYHKPHIPLKFPLEFLDAYPITDMPLVPNRSKPPGMPTIAWNPWNDLRRRDDIRALNVSYPYGPLPDSYARYIRQGYYAATTYTDSLIGDLLDTVNHLFPDTIVALIGDHGWSLGEHQEWSKFSNFEVATRVPFIVTKLSQQSGHAFNGFSKIFQKNNSSYSFSPDNRLQFSTLYKRQFKSHLTYIPEIKSYRGQRGETSKHNWKNSVPQIKSLNMHEGLVELVDLFPTLVDLAGIPALSICPENSRDIQVCSEGMSLSPLIKKYWDNKTLNHASKGGKQNAIKLLKQMAEEEMKGKKAAFSQYPRPGLHPTRDPDSDQPHLHNIKFMGYSMRTNRYRYTAWLKFNNVTFKPDFNYVISEELYDHFVDPDENFNLSKKRMYRNKKVHLKTMLTQCWGKPDEKCKYTLR